MLAAANIGLDRARDLASNIEVIGGGGMGVTTTGRTDHGLSTTHSSGMQGMGKSRRTGPFRESVSSNAQDELQVGPGRRGSVPQLPLPFTASLPQKLLEKRQLERSHNRFKAAHEVARSGNFSHPAEEIYSDGGLDRTATVLLALLGGFTTDIPVSLLQEYIAGAQASLAHLPAVEKDSKYRSLLEEAIHAEVQHPLPEWPALDLQRMLRRQKFMFGLQAEQVPPSWQVCHRILSSYSQAFASQAKTLRR